MIVDVAVDQGGCIETIRETTHDDPVYELHGVIHYAVGNMPGAVPHTSTYALTNATLPYIHEVAVHGPAGAARRDPALALGVNTVAGQSPTNPSPSSSASTPSTPSPPSTPPTLTLIGVFAALECQLRTRPSGNTPTEATDVAGRDTAPSTSSASSARLRRSVFADRLDLPRHAVQAAISAGSPP